VKMLQLIKDATFCPACGAIAPVLRKTRIPIQTARWVCGSRCYSTKFFDPGLNEELDVEEVLDVEALEQSAGALPPELRNQLDAKKEGSSGEPSLDLDSLL